MEERSAEIIKCPECGSDKCPTRGGRCKIIKERKDQRSKYCNFCRCYTKDNEEGDCELCNYSRPNYVRQGPYSTKRQKIEWLIKNKTMWEGFPQERYKLYSSKEFTTRLNNIIDRMVEDELYSPATLKFDITTSVFRYIQQARKELRK